MSERKRKKLNGKKMRQVLALFIGNFTSPAMSIYGSVSRLSHIAPARRFQMSSLPWSTSSCCVALSTMPHVNVK